VAVDRYHELLSDELDPGDAGREDGVAG
jgi:hypothetical protein